ncbi:MAG: TadA family conjugal transfer-associated ATPase [Actinomycetes bacterium]|jgi:pilus assembly protein CpaF
MEQGLPEPDIGAVGSMIATPALTDQVREHLAQRSLLPTRSALAEAVRIQLPVVSDASMSLLIDQLHAELVGYSLLQPFLDDEAVTDVLVNGCDQIFVDRGSGLEKTDVRFIDDAHVRRLAVRLAASVGRRLDDSSPCVDCGLDRGVRLHAVLPPVAGNGPVVSLRIPRQRTLTLEQLQVFGAFGQNCLEWLHAVIDTRLSFLLTGGTGTGKTTMLSALLSAVPSEHRLVLVEDSAELRPEHPHVVWLQARNANAEGQGYIGVRELIRNALRMRPDRLVVGEARGPEVIDLLAAMNTGHEGGCGTLHANTPADVPARVAALAAPAGWSRESSNLQLASALDLVIHLVRDRDGKRYVQQIATITNDQGSMMVEPALIWDGQGFVASGPALETLKALVTRT